MATSMKHLTAFASVLAMAACATPGIDYTASIAPGNPEAAKLRTVAVERFRGPLAGWYADQFEAMLAEAQFEGQNWFQVGLFSRQSNIEGVYGGDVQISPPYVDETYHTYSECIKRDEDTDKCLKRRDVERVCLDYTIEVAVTPQLLDAQTNQLVHRATYTAADSERECFETGRVVYRIRRGPDDPGRGKYRFGYEDYGNPGYRLGGDYIIDRITANALQSTIWQARQDIAPYNQQVRAKILTEAENLEVRADPRFAQAVEGIRNGNYTFSCVTFTTLAEEYQNAPAVLHNLGACAEASGNSEAAQAHYAEAAAEAQALGGAPAKRILNALDRISGTRSDEIVLESLVPTDEGRFEGPAS